MSVDINTLFQMLRWDSPEEVQKKGIKEAGKVEWISVFFQPQGGKGGIEGKDVWENCAKVICSKTDDELEMWLWKMFEWIQDMNWPGAFLIYDRLKEMKADFIVMDYMNAVRKASLLKDEPWLAYLASFADNPELYALLPKKYQKLMDKQERWI